MIIINNNIINSNWFIFSMALWSYGCTREVAQEKHNSHARPIAECNFGFSSA